MVQKAKAYCRELQLAVGDKVLVHLQPYRQISVTHKASQKLSKCFYGPFTVVKRIGPVAYKLDLPSSCRSHPVFHVSAIKPYHGSVPIEGYHLPLDSVDDKPISSPAAICALRTILRQGKEHRQVLV